MPNKRWLLRKEKLKYMLMILRKINELVDKNRYFPPSS